MKKKLLIIAAALICAATVSIGTAAYYTAESTARNVITTGKVDIELNEYAEDGNGARGASENEFAMVPGKSLSKIVTVENVGQSEAWIRVRLEKSITAAAEADPDVMEMNIDTENWTEKDGWYYYNEALAPEEETEPLFTEVSFAETMSNDYQNSTAKLDIAAQATQTANNGASVTEAAGWPTE